MSKSVKLKSGAPQGGILSPVLFIIFVADMEDWTEKSGVFTYADDTSTNTSNKSLEIVLEGLERDAEGILQ
jgi:retron-type reverse transcriptase